MIFNSFLNISLAWIYVICWTISLVTCSTYTDQEIIALKKFRPLIENVLSQDYMTEDVYLIKFLRAENLNLKEAEDSLRETMKWRKMNNIDNILKEDFSNIYKELVYYLDGIDNEGRPILIIPFKTWDIRKYAISGRRSQITRYWDQILERLEKKIQDLRNSSTHQNDVPTKGIVIFDIDGYNLRQHGCLRCIPVILEWLSHADRFYPGLAQSIHMINCPRIFTPLLEILKPAMSPNLRKALKAYGPDKTEWVKVLLETIPPDQLRPQYGGTRNI